MTLRRDAGVATQYSDDAKQRQEPLDELPPIQETPRRVTSPDARAALAREMWPRTDLVGRVWVGDHLPQALDPLLGQLRKYSS